MTKHAWIDAVVAEIRLHAEAALLRRLNAGAGDPRSPSQIYLRAPAAAARIAGGTLRPQNTHAKANAEGEAAIDEASARSAKLVASADDSRLAVLCNRLGVGAVPSGLVAIALAYALGLDARELVRAHAPRRGDAMPCRSSRMPTRGTTRAARWPPITRTRSRARPGEATHSTPG